MIENNRPSEKDLENAEKINNEEEIDSLSYDFASESEETEFLDLGGETEPKHSFAKEVYEWISSIAIAVVLALLINHFVFALVQVDGQSMEPTLYHNERLIVRKLLYTPEQKDIVILKSEAIQKYIVKRVIALPGQTVEFDEARNVLVDGIKLDEPYIKDKQISSGNLYNYPLVVPKKGEIANLDFIMTEARLKAGNGTMTLAINEDGNYEINGSELVDDGVFVSGKTTYKQDCYFVMGDNRNHSSDSRTLGLIPKSEVVGKSSVRLFPFSKFGTVE